MSQGTGCIGCKVSSLLAGLGALNWALVAFFGLNLVARVLGDMTALAKIAYALIGIAGVMKLVSVFGCCPCQKGGACEPKK